jgi:hypothetical protein
MKKLIVLAVMLFVMNVFVVDTQAGWPVKIGDPNDPFASQMDRMHEQEKSDREEIQQKRDERRRRQMKPYYHDPLHPQKNSVPKGWM